MCFHLDSSGSSSQQKSDGVEGKRGHSLLFIIVSRRWPGGGVQQKMGRGGKTQGFQGSRGPQPCIPQQFFPVRWQAANSHLGDWSDPLLLQFAVEFNNLLQPFPFTQGSKSACCYPMKRRGTAVSQSMQISKLSGRSPALIYWSGDFAKLGDGNLVLIQRFISVIQLIYRPDFLGNWAFLVREKHSSKRDCLALMKAQPILSFLIKTSKFKLQVTFFCFLYITPKLPWWNSGLSLHITL